MEPVGTYEERIEKIGQSIRRRKMAGTKEVPFSSLSNFTPKQVEAIKQADFHKFLLYGGSRGPGKSYWLRWALVREGFRLAAIGFRGFVMGLFCEDYPSLTEKTLEKLEKWLGKNLSL